ncbi:hypothetical protein HZC07_04810 [Candidatus Micrarchaeota archaeon]|nr:hypothetical protein [Candidatus Micrarchaeota archaeon]
MELDKSEHADNSTQPFRVNFGETKTFGEGQLFSVRAVRGSEPGTAIVDVVSTPPKE